MNHIPIPLTKERGDVAIQVRGKELSFFAKNKDGQVQGLISRWTWHLVSSCLAPVCIIGILAGRGRKLIGRNPVVPRVPKVKN